MNTNTSTVTKEAFVWTNQKTAKLLELVLVHGTDWVTISRMIGCTNTQAQTKFQHALTDKEKEDLRKQAQKNISLLTKVMKRFRKKGVNTNSSPGLDVMVQTGDDPITSDPDSFLTEPLCDFPVQNDGGFNDAFLEFLK